MIPVLFCFRIVEFVIMEELTLDTSRYLESNPYLPIKDWRIRLIRVCPKIMIPLAD